MKHFNRTGTVRGIIHRGKEWLASAILLVALQGWCVPIIYTFSGFGSGALGDNSFSGSFFQITATANTTDLYSPSPGIWRVANASASVLVDGLGTGTFSSSTISVDNQNLSRVGISDPGQGMAILFVDNPVFAGYDLRTALGPISGPVIAYNPGAQFSTSVGPFSFTGVSSATFEAIIVPEPSVGILVVVGVFVLNTCRSRRR